MIDLAQDVAELFSGLDGYADYPMAIAVFIETRLAYRREYVRLPHVRAREAARARRADVRARRLKWAREKRKTDPAWRAARLAYHREWRAKHGFKIRKYGPLEAKHGTHNAYKHHHCRCRACTDAMAAYARARKAAA